MSGGEIKGSTLWSQFIVTLSQIRVSYAPHCTLYTVFVLYFTLFTHYTFTRKLILRHSNSNNTIFKHLNTMTILHLTRGRITTYWLNPSKMSLNIAIPSSSINNYVGIIIFIFYKLPYHWQVSYNMQKLMDEAQTYLKVFLS